MPWFGMHVVQQPESHLGNDVENDESLVSGASGGSQEDGTDEHGGGCED